MTINEKTWLIRRFLKGESTTSELKKLYSLFNSKQGEDKIMQLFQDEMPEDDVLHQESIDSIKMLTNIKYEINKRRKGRLLSFTTMKYAAAILVLIGISGILSYYLAEKSKNTTEAVFTVVETKRGETTNVTLPDGTTIMLNSESKLTYSSNYGVSNRNIELQGQAFLDVVRNEQLPFVLKSNDFQIAVLGTRFDVEAYPESGKVNVLLEKGSVQLTNNKVESFGYIMKEGELASYDLGRQDMHLQKVNLKNYLAWREGKLIFREEPMETVFAKLERRYDIDIVYNPSDICSSIFTATISDEPLAEIMKYIEMTCSVKCRIVNGSDTDTTKVYIEK